MPTTLRRTILGRLLVTYRAQRGIGIRELAKEVGVSSATLSRVERGHAMDATTLIQIWTWLQQPEV